MLSALFRVNCNTYANNIYDTNLYVSQHDCPHEKTTLHNIKKNTNDLGTVEHNQSLYFESVVQGKDPRTINRMELHRKSHKKTGLYGGTINDSVCFETPSPLKDTFRS